MTHRLHYIDNLKGVLILLVVLGHCIQCTDLDFDHNAVFRYIYSFHMPLFMCVSGFVSYKPDIKWQTVQKRFRQLIIPFLAWVAVSCCVHLDPTLFLAKVVHPDSGLWFLWTLFFIVLLMWLCNWIVTSHCKLNTVKQNVTNSSIFPSTTASGSDSPCYKII